MLQRIFLIIAVLAGVGVIVVSQTKLREHIQGIISERDTNKQNWTKETSRANKAETSLAAKTKDWTDERSAHNTTKQNLSTANANLETVSAARDKAVADAQKAKDAEKAALQNLEAWRLLAITPDQVKATILNLAKAKEANAVLDLENNLLDRRNKKLQTELDKLLIGDEYVVKLPTGLKGKVLIVDPKWQFVVLDIGENQGVLKDGVMMIHRSSKLVGKVRISSVMPDRCIANLMPGWKLDEVQEGDLVLY